MSATAAAVNPANPPAPSARPAANPSSPADEGRFDRHLDAARQQHDPAGDQPAADDGRPKPAAKAAPSAASDHKPVAVVTAKTPDEDADAVALAAAMLALIGQAAPAKPAALAAHLAQAAPKAIAGVQAANPPAALMLLAGAAAASAASAVKATGLDTGALAPMLAKPAEQKDAPLDALQMAGLATPPAAASANPATVVPVHDLNIASPAGTPAFAQELGQHIAWLGTQDVKQARIRLHPEDLGTLDVKVSMNHDRVDVSFAVQHPAAVHAVQQTLPQLDALLAHHGLTLGQTDVGQRQQHGEGGRGGEATGAIGEVDAEPAVMASASVTALGMLDTFA